jgi:hypothetical protein
MGNKLFEKDRKLKLLKDDVLKKEEHMRQDHDEIQKYKEALKKQRNDEHKRS